MKIAVLFTLFLATLLPVYGQNPITDFQIEMIDQESFGMFYPEYDVSFRLAMDDDFTVTSVHCLLDSEEFEDPQIESWINTDGLDNGDVTISTDSTTGDLIIHFGILEIPLGYNAEVKAKDNNDIEYDIVLPF